MVTSPTGKGVIVMGGQKAGTFPILMGRLTVPFKDSKEMYELTQSMEWTRLEQSLQFGEWYNYPLAIPIPDELVSKQE